MDGLVRDRLRFKESMGVTEGVRVGRMAGGREGCSSDETGGGRLAQIAFPQPLFQN